MDYRSIDQGVLISFLVLCILEMAYAIFDANIWQRDWDLIGGVFSYGHVSVLYFFLLSLSDVLKPV